MIIKKYIYITNNYRTIDFVHLGVCVVGCFFLFFFGGGGGGERERFWFLKKINIIIFFFFT